MEKQAVTDLAIHPLLARRWSPRSFTEQPVPKESLQRIFEAARWAPSSFNEQPWRFIVGIKGEKTWDMILDTLVEFNQNWARLAPVLAISVGKKVSSKNQKPNKMYQYDLGQSVAYITFQATQEGLYIHQMGGFDAEKAAKHFQIPDEYQALTTFAIGHMGKPELLPDDMARMERSARERIPISDLIFEGSFGNTASFI